MRISYYYFNYSENKITEKDKIRDFSIQHSDYISGVK